MRKFVLAVLLLVGTAAYADTLKFTGTTANGEYGPYSMSLNGSTTTTPMICFSDNNWITGGETWSAQALNISQITAGALSGTLFPGSVAQYNELGYLADELFADPGNSDLQLAIWSVFGLSSPFAATSGSTLDFKLAYDAVNGGCASNGVCSSGGYVASDVLFYIPSGPNLPLVNGTPPQPFISEVPEPSSLVLLVSGMVALMLLVIRRGKA